MSNLIDIKSMFDVSEEMNLERLAVSLATSVDEVSPAFPPIRK